MKKTKFLLLFLCLIGISNTCFAYKYCEDDKRMFYDAFLDGYITEMKSSVEKLNIEQEKKDKFISLLQERIDREYLIKSSWECIQKYPVEQIVSASVICTTEWNKKQTQTNKDLFDLLK
jgi:hypothetical protein